jgi:hypothetical protein
MLGSLVGALARAVLSTLVDYLRQKRAEENLVARGKLEVFKERVEANVKLSKEVRAVRHRIATDPEYAKRVRDSFRSGPS